MKIIVTQTGMSSESNRWRAVAKGWFLGTRGYMSEYGPTPDAAVTSLLTSMRRVVYRFPTKRLTEYRGDFTP